MNFIYSSKRYLIVLLGLAMFSPSLKAENDPFQPPVYFEDTIACDENGKMECESCYASAWAMIQMTCYWDQGVICWDGGTYGGADPSVPYCYSYPFDRNNPFMPAFRYVSEPRTFTCQAKSNNPANPCGPNQIYVGRDRELSEEQLANALDKKVVR